MGMAERIKERRLFLNYTQEELAQKLGLQKSAIAKYENGRVENIKRSVIAKMAEVLECSPAYLMGWDDKKSDEGSYAKIQMIMDQQFIDLYSYWELLSERGKEKLIDYASDLCQIYKKENS